MTIERILGTDTGTEAFGKTDRNFLTIDGEKLPTSHNSDNTAHNDIREQINTLIANLTWTTVTLQNGWSGTLKCASIDTLGLVFLQGTLTAGTVAVDTVIGNVPTGFRPLTIAVPIPMRKSSSAPLGTYLGAILLSSGNIMIRQPLTDNIATGGTMDINAMFTKRG